MRIAFGILVLFVGAGFGFAHRSPWVIIILGIVFCALYVAGKWYQWRLSWRRDGLNGIAKALALTLPVQIILAGILYLIGLGLGHLVNPRALAGAITQVDVVVALCFLAVGVFVSMIIDRIEGGNGPLAVDGQNAAQNPSAQSGHGEDDFKVLGPVTLDQLFVDYRGWSDFSKNAVINGTDFKGNRFKHAPLAANEAMIADAEARLGIALPQGLRELYRFRNGGDVKDVMVAKTENAPPVFGGNWVSVFQGYNSIASLSQLQTVYDATLEYASPEDKDMFPDGAENMVILARMYEETTFLDYRHGASPRIGVVDFDDDDWQDTGLWFDDWDHFWSSLQFIDSDNGRQTKTEQEAGATGPNVDDPDRFWCIGAARDHGASQEMWQAAETRLGVALPDALFPYMRAVNGGAPHFCLIKQTGHQSVIEAFPGNRIYGVDQWTTLAELSDLLDFDFGFPRWRDRWLGCEQMVVLACSFDRVLMLDYRDGAEPQVLHVDSLDNDDQGVVLGTVPAFLESLRAPAKTWQGESLVVTDRRLSSRNETALHFWQNPQSGLTQEVIDAHGKRLGFKIPKPLSAWFKVQNGGAVRFRYLVPYALNINGYLNPVADAKEWFDIFPDGLAPMEAWIFLDDWLARSGEDLGDALRQKGFSQYVKDEFGDPKRIIVLAQGDARLTLLDISRETTAENASLVQVVRRDGIWEENYRSVMITAASFRAPISELPD